MPAPPSIITHGTSGTLLLSEEITTRNTDFDDGYLEYLAAARDAFEPGGNPPEFPAMTILEVNSRAECDEFICRVRVQGLMTGSSRRISSSFTANLEGFDDGQESHLTLNPTEITIGSVASGYAHMICVSVTRETLGNGWHRLTPRYLGSLGTKPYKRRIAVDGQTVQPSDPFSISLPGGWAGTQKGRIDLPEVTVEDRYVSTARPNTALVPGNETPPDAPAVSGIAITGDLTYQWPHGWTLTGIEWDPIPGTTIGIETRRYRCKFSATF